MVVKIEVMQIKERCFTETFLFKFKFFILKLWEFAHLFAATACVNLVFPPQKLNSHETLQRDTGDLKRPFLIEGLQFLLCNLR